MWSISRLECVKRAIFCILEDYPRTDVDALMNVYVKVCCNYHQCCNRLLIFRLKFFFWENFQIKVNACNRNKSFFWIFETQVDICCHKLVYISGQRNSLNILVVIIVCHYLITFTFTPLLIYCSRKTWPWK